MRWLCCGTAAAGSLIIAIVKTIRAFVAKLQEQAEKRGGKLANVYLGPILRRAHDNYSYAGLWAFVDDTVARTEGEAKQGEAKAEGEAKDGEAKDGEVKAEGEAKAEAKPAPIDTFVGVGARAFVEVARI